MSQRIAKLLNDVVTPPQSSAFHVRAIPDLPAYYVGRDHGGHAAVLVRASGVSRVTPMRLAGIEARFGVPCSIADQEGTERTETLSVILCLSKDPQVEGLFAAITESLVTLMGSTPTAAELMRAVDHLAELFQRIREPPRRPLIGLVGELCLIYVAHDARAAVEAWRSEVAERFDFAVGNLRLDVKSSATDRRIYTVSFDQTNPPTTAQGVFATVRVDASAGATRLRELLARIERRRSMCQVATSKMWRVVAETLGSDLASSLEWAFDLDRAIDSIELVDARTVPSFRGPLPEGVSGVRFDSDFSGVPTIAIEQCNPSLSEAARLIMPLPRESTHGEFD